MKFISFLSFGLLLLLPLEHLRAFSSQPPANRTGAPPFEMTCAACHTGTGNGNIEMSFGGGTMNYLPGQTYEIEVKVTDSGQERFGFSMTARKEESPSENTGAWTAGENSTVYDGGNHIGHSNAPFADDEFTFTVDWTAPDEAEAGPVTFYFAGNAANGNFANGAGDNIYNDRLTVTPREASEPFWNASPLVDGWRNTGEGFSDLVGIGWIRDDQWPWIFTFAHQGSDDGEWIFVFEEVSSRSGFWGYNAAREYFFWGAASFGWYFSFADGEEDWFAYEL